MNEKLQILSEMLPLINDLIHDDCYLTVLAADSTVVGYDIPAGRSPLVTVGKPFQDPTGAFEEVVRTGKVKHNMLPKEVMGEVCEGILTPIKEGNQVIGILTCTHSLGDQMQYIDMTKEFENSMKTITVSIGDVINGMENMFQMLTDMNDHTVTVDSDVKNATDVVSKIASNASRSNILALNASIEAARSGEAGRGFAVVAGEMGKLANDSGKSAKEIGVTLDAISHHLKEISDSIHNTDQVAKDYLEGVNSVKEELEKTLQIANALKKSVQG